MKISDILQDIKNKSDIHFNSGAKPYMLDYYLSKEIFLYFKKWCRNQRKTNKEFLNKEYLSKYGGISIVKTDNPNLHFQLLNQIL